MGALHGIMFSWDGSSGRAGTGQAMLMPADPRSGCRPGTWRWRVLELAAEMDLPGCRGHRTG